MADPYPRWFYYPSRVIPPAWVDDVVRVFRSARDRIDSEHVQGKQSDGILAELAPGLMDLGFEIETGKGRDDRITRPVLFGDEGRPRVSYEVDGVHDDLGIVLEVEAGRGWMGNAFYRDLVRTSLILNARYLVLGLMTSYRYKSSGRENVNRSYELAKDQLDAVYASDRLALPFEGILLIGY